MFSDNSLNQLHALHRVLTRTRSQAYLGLASKDVGKILDEAEYLVTLLMRGQENTDEFRQILERIEQRFGGFEGLVAAFDEGGEEDAVMLAQAVTVPK